MPPIAMTMHVKIPALPLAANLDFSRAPAGLAFAATTAHRTRVFVSECGADLVSRRFSSAVATCTIPIARRVTIMASQGGHAAPPTTFSTILIHGLAFVKLRRLVFHSSVKKF